MKRILAYLNLYRLDAFAITFLSYLVPLLMFRASLLPVDFLMALLISSISINSVYSLNSWFDRDIDKVNKPGRPIPSGLISPRNAMIYSFVLVAVSLIYPWLLDVSLTTKLLFLTIPFCGLLYSNPFFPFKKKMLLSVALTSYLMVSPTIIAFTGNGYITDYFYIPVYLILYALSTIPLKDIEDMQGDVMHQSQNWSDKVGYKRLFWASSILLIAIAVSAFFFIPGILYQVLIFAFCINSALFLMIGAIYLQVAPHRIYKLLIRFDILQGVSFMIVYKLFA